MPRTQYTCYWGNVSFYNENPESAVFPTPTIGMLGLIEDIDKRMTAPLKAVGDDVYLLTPAAWLHKNAIDGSEYLSWIHKKTAGDVPHFELEEEVAVQEALYTLIQQGVVKSAHDVSDGGLAVCLAESVIFSDGLGLNISLDATDIRLDALLFGEAQSRIVFTAAPDDRVKIEGQLAALGVQAHKLGTVTAGGLAIHYNGTPLIDLDASALETPYESAIPSLMAGN